MMDGKERVFQANATPDGGSGAGAKPLSRNLESIPGSHHRMGGCQGSKIRLPSPSS